MCDMRLDKFLTSQNICTRSEAKKLAREGRVSVNGIPAAKSDEKIDPERDTIEVDGAVVSYKKYLYIMMNKPEGVLSATNDKNTPTVLDILPDEYKRRGLFPAGRLDKDTTGLLIITDDGEFAHKMLSPKSGIYKRYIALLDKELSDYGKAELEKGVTLSDGTAYRPARIFFDNADKTTVTAEITEGKFHEVKNMFLYVGCEVLKLKRISIGGLELGGNLAEGESRLISEKELKAIFNGHIS